MLTSCKQKESFLQACCSMQSKIIYNSKLRWKHLHFYKNASKFFLKRRTTLERKKKPKRPIHNCSFFIMPRHYPIGYDLHGLLCLCLIFDSRIANGWCTADHCGEERWQAHCMKRPRWLIPMMDSHGIDIFTYILHTMKNQSHMCQNI